MSIAYQRVRDTLASAGSTFANVKDQRFMAQCPAHEDHNPSLEVIDKGDKVVLACYAGCPTDDVAASIGMVMADLFDDDVVSSGNPIAAATLSRSYLYEKPNGEPWFYVDRYFPKTFRQRLPDKDPARSLGRPDGAQVLRAAQQAADHLPRAAAVAGHAETRLNHLLARR